MRFGVVAVVHFLFLPCYARGVPTVCVTCVWAGVDNAWEQEKPEARKLLENAADSHTSGARFVGCVFILPTTWTNCKTFYHSIKT